MTLPDYYYRHNVLNMTPRKKILTRIFGVRPSLKQLMENRKKILSFTYNKFWKPKPKKIRYLEKKYGRYLPTKKRRRRRINKRANYKSRRYVGYYFRYARNYLRTRRFFLKNIMVIKRFVAYGSGFLRKRQFRSLVDKTNSKIVRPTDARMTYFTVFTGILNNALFSVGFARPIVFRNIDQLICHGNFMINERLSRYGNTSVKVGDKLEVVHNFWVKKTKVYYLNFRIRRKNQKKIWRKQARRRKLFTRRSSTFLRRQRYRKHRRFVYVYKKHFDKIKRGLIKRFVYLTRRSRWKLKFAMHNSSKRRKVIKYANVSRARKHFKLPANILLEKDMYDLKVRNILFKKSLYHLTRAAFCRLLQLKVVYSTCCAMTFIAGKIPNRKLLRKLSRIMYIRFYSSLRKLSSRFIRRRYYLKKKSVQKHFRKYRLRKYLRIPRSWQTCMYARTALRLRPISHSVDGDKRFKTKLLLMLFKNYNKFRY